MNYFSFRNRPAWVYIVVSFLTYGLSEIFYLTKTLKQVAPINKHILRWLIHLVAILLWGLGVSLIFYQDYLQGAAATSSSASLLLQQISNYMLILLFVFLLAIGTTIETIMKSLGGDEYSDKADAVDAPAGHGGLGRLISIGFAHKQGVTRKTVWSYMMFLTVMLNCFGVPPYVSVWLQNFH